MTPLRQALTEYLRIRRRLGFELVEDGRLLELFVCFLEQAGAERITTELALAWARLPVHANPQRWRQRLSIVRAFARYLTTIDPDSEVPSKDLLPAHYVRVAPYIYSPAEIAALIEAARALTPPLRAATFATIIGLLAASGLRPGEARGLDRHDVDLRGGALHVRAAKQNKQREVPLHASVTEALHGYASVRDRHWSRPITPAFFISTRGGRLAKSSFSRTFRGLVKQAGLEGHGARRYPRAHDLRHTFAVCTLVDLHRAGEDVDRRMPELSAFLGHAKPASSYWYLQAVPELLALISSRLERLPEALS
jgi:integrase/recombinase XerD